MGLENCQEAVPARAGIARFGSAPGNPSQTETLCYYPNAKVVSIIALRDKTSSASKEKDLKILWDSQIERTIAVGKCKNVFHHTHEVRIIAYAVSRAASYI